MASLRDLLNITTAESLIASATPIEGEQEIYQFTCWDDDGHNQHDGCCEVFISPASVTCATIEVWGGGGAGGGLASCCDENSCIYGPGGGAGAYVVKCLTGLSSDCFSIIVGQKTNCSCNWTGCEGCYSCVCSPYGDLCAQGGPGGEMYCNWGCGVCCSGTANAYGGDININGLPGKYCAKCISTDCFSYNQHLIPYPGGLVNLCGGWVQTQQRECSGCRICNYCQYCLAMEALPTFAAPLLRCYGYVPGIPGASAVGYCECECERPCQCGPAGNPGMVRITYK